MVLYFSPQTLSLGLACRPWPALLGCGSSDCVMFRVCAVYLGLPGLSATAEAPTGPTGAAWGLAWLGPWESLGGGERSQTPGRWRLPGLDCLFRWESPSPGAPENVGRGRQSQTHGDKGISQARSLYMHWQNPLACASWPPKSGLPGDGNLRPFPIATYCYGSPNNSLFLGARLAWWYWTDNRSILGRKESTWAPSCCWVSGQDAWGPGHFVLLVDTRHPTLCCSFDQLVWGSIPIPVLLTPAMFFFGCLVVSRVYSYT